MIGFSSDFMRMSLDRAGFLTWIITTTTPDRSGNNRLAPVMRAGRSIVTNTFFPRGKSGTTHLEHRTPTGSVQTRETKDRHHQVCMLPYASSCVREKSDWGWGYPPLVRPCIPQCFMRAIETCRSADLGGHCPFLIFQTTQLITRNTLWRMYMATASWVYNDWQFSVAGVSL